MFINLVNIYSSHCIAFIVTFFWNEYISFFLLGVPLLAITGTADESTQKTIYQQLTMNKTMVKLFVRPNKENLKFKVAKVKKDEAIAQLTWLVNELREKGPLTPQTLIFSCTVRDIATIANWFLVKMDNAAFS